MRGIYAILISVREGVWIRVGCLGRLRFNPGTYVYVGSGSGEASTSVEGRITRHFSKPKSKHWHIDYLLGNRLVEPVSAVLSEAGASYECELARILSEDVEARALLDGFGSSDCSCPSHLIYFGDLSLGIVEVHVMRGFRALGLNPKKQFKSTL
ncbi:MAG: GIY-YIG nuclease family protein [Candidatus Bathyarchaeia archaeon]